MSDWKRKELKEKKRREYRESRISPDHELSGTRHRQPHREKDIALNWSRDKNGTYHVSPSSVPVGGGIDISDEDYDIIWAPKIPLTQDQYAIVDKDDYDRLNAYKWYAKWNDSTQSYYACRNGDSVTIRMHREILGLHKGDEKHGDHINHDTLDNRRSNLRVLPHRENNEHRKKKSPYGTGIYRNGEGYGVKVWANGEHHNVGTYSTPGEARAARKDFLYDMGIVD